MPSQRKFCTGSFFVLAGIMVLSNIFYALSAPFLPPVFEAKRVSAQYVGVVFAAFSIASVIFSPHVAKMIEDFGQPKLVGFSMALMGVSVFCFGFVANIDGPASIIILALFLRFV